MLYQRLLLINKKDVLAYWGNKYLPPTYLRMFCSVVAGKASGIFTPLLLEQTRATLSLLSLYSFLQSISPSTTKTLAFS